ncbi:MAG TPA: DUF4397 domain-containing protein [Casimicrobiaceae bacterium]|nr:DUF4397 domain-containing protein [Casimicrobiaceae bacterium]
MEIPIILRRLLTLLVSLAALALLTSCDSGNGVGATPNLTRIRVINLVPNAPSIQVQLDSDAPFVTGLTFEQVTQYIVVSEGVATSAREFKVSADGGQTNIIDVSANLLAATDYTFVVYGPVEAVHQTLVLDTNTLIPNGGTFDLRVINVATGINAVDLYLTVPGVDLSLTAPSVSATPVGSTSFFANIPTGNYELRVTPVGSKAVIYDAIIGDVFPDKSLNEVVVFGKGSANLVSAGVLLIDANGTGQVVDSTLAELKVLNGTSLGAPLNVFVDGVLTLANIPIAGVSNYQKVAAGTRTVTVQSAATPGATLLTVVVDLPPATDTSVAVSGSAGALQSLVLSDNNLPSAVNRARVRFVNASPDLGPVDAYVNFVKTFENIASNTASPYTEVEAVATGTTYEFDFNVAGTTTPVLMIPNVVLTPGKTYTIYVVGSASAPQGVVSLDD